MNSPKLKLAAKNKSPSTKLMIGLFSQFLIISPYSPSQTTFNPPRHSQWKNYHFKSSSSNSIEWCGIGWCWTILSRSLSKSKSCWCLSSHRLSYISKIVCFFLLFCCGWITNYSCSNGDRYSISFFDRSVPFMMMRHHSCFHFGMHFLRIYYSWYIYSSWYGVDILYLSPLRYVVINQFT